MDILEDDSKNNFIESSLKVAFLFSYGHGLIPKSTHIRIFIDNDPQFFTLVLENDEITTKKTGKYIRLLFD